MQGAFLDRVYPNRFSDLKVGRTRYGVLTGDAGRIMDDGASRGSTTTTFYVSATSTGADGVFNGSRGGTPSGSWTCSSPT